MTGVAAASLSMGALLRLHRERLRLSEREAALAAGLTVPHVVRTEHDGFYGMTRLFAARLLAAYDRIEGRTEGY